MKNYQSVIFFIIVGLFGAPSYAQTDVVETVTKTMRFGDWTVRCEKQGKEKESCVMSLTLTAQENGTEIAQANFAKQDEGTLMTLILPLGVFLTPGVLLDIKEHKKFGYPITFCTRDGCFVNQLISDEAVELLRKKEKATLTFASNAQRSVELPFSLTGFLDAFKKL